MNTTGQDFNWSNATSTNPSPDETSILNSNPTGIEILSLLFTRFAHNPTYLFALIAVGVVASVGIVLNIISLIVLLQPRMRSTSINILLIGLEICDTLSSAGILCTIGPVGILLVAYVPQIWDWVGIYSTYFIVASYYFLILISIERYIVICHPMKVQVLCSPQRAVISSLSVFIFFILLAVLDSLDLKLGNEVEQNMIRLVLLFVIPFLAQLYFNYCIYLGYRKARETARSLSSTKAEENNTVTLVSLWIVLVFLICNSLYVLQYSYNLLDIHKNWFYTAIVAPLTPLAFSINAGCNFIFYCSFGTKFRKELRQVLGCKSKHKAPQDQNNYRFKSKPTLTSSKQTTGITDDQST